jgi:hypothetical protein
MRFHLENNKLRGKTPQVPTLGAHFSGWNKRKQRAAHLKLRDVCICGLIFLSLSLWLQLKYS